jgi:hypothetical protein
MMRAANASRSTFLLSRVNETAGARLRSVRLASGGNARIGLVPSRYDGRSRGTSSWMTAPFGSFEDTVMRPSS